MKPIKSLVLFYNSKREKAAAYADKLEEKLQSKLALQKICVYSGIKPACNAEAALAVGGDGTVLHAARNAALGGLPVLGINAGSLGFLSCISQEDFLASIDNFLAGHFARQERMLLFARVIRNNAAVFGPLPALNDCVIRSYEPRAFGLKASLNGKLLTKYFGDGLIIATPSGSTAYNLAASGPIVSPELSLFVLSPICPHALTQRPLILPPKGKINIELLGTKSGRQDFTVSLDGQENFTLETGDIIELSEYEKKLTLLVPENYDYFATLRNKLRWGER